MNPNEQTEREAKELHYKLQRNQKIWDDHTCILEVTETLQRAETRGREFTNIGEWANEHAKAYKLGMLRAAEIVEGFFKNETRIDGGWQYNIAKAIRKEANENRP